MNSAYATAHPNGQVQAHRQQQQEELCLAAIRALTGEADLHFRGRLLHRGHRRLPMHVPHLYPSPEEPFASFRGAADGMAMRLAWSDPELHRELAPDDRTEAVVFEMLEQFRAESLAPPHLAGVVANLRQRHEQWSLAFHHSGLTETYAGLLLYTVAQVCRAQVTGQPVVQETEDLLEATRAGISPLIGKDLAALRRHRSDQRPYGLHALAIARSVGHMLAQEGTGGADAEGDADDRVHFPLFVDFDDDADESGLPAAFGRGREVGDFEHGYRVFTRSYDRECPVSSLVRLSQLRTLRDHLDRRVAAQGVNVPRLARQLREILAEPARDGWEGGRDEGYVDGRRLALLVSSPGEQRVFQTERVDAVPDCLVTFLVDCSGSMKQHAESVATLVDILGRALDLGGVSTEILGFTTGSWNGGRALRDWRRAGRPAQPGRLNELLHIVFKNADTSWRLARPSVAGLLKPELFREGVDGEAVEWARGRMLRRPESRRLLVVVSDGSPMDSATSLANGERYLDDHLTQVVRRHEQRSDVRIHGLGVGLDLSPYYSLARALDLSEGTTNRVFGEILGMLAGGGRRR